MAKSEILKPFVLSWEGGYTDDPDDRGGATNRGVTLAVYRSVMGTGKTKGDLRRITDAEWDTVFRALYWDKCMGDALDVPLCQYACGLCLAQRHVKGGESPAGRCGSEAGRSDGAQDAPCSERQ